MITRKLSTEGGAQTVTRYLRSDDTRAVLLASAVLLEPERLERSELVADRGSAAALAEFGLAAAQRASVMRGIADHLACAAAVARVALIGCSDYGAVMAEAEAGPEHTDDGRG